MKFRTLYIDHYIRRSCDFIKYPWMIENGCYQDGKKKTMNPHFVTIPIH